MNWTEDDIAKPQVLVESAYGMGHPGTFHFRGLIDEVSNGVFEAGGRPAEFMVSDICDGVVQATEGMSYSLISRDVMAAMIEIYALGHPHDAMVLISGNDKSVPAHLLAMARCDLRPDNPLFGLHNVVIMPHAAYYSEEAISTVRHFAAEEVVRVLTGQAPLSPVNAGELAEARRSRSA